MILQVHVDLSPVASLQIHPGNLTISKAARKTQSRWGIPDVVLFQEMSQLTNTPPVSHDDHSLSPSYSDMFDTEDLCLKLPKRSVSQVLCHVSS